MNNMTPGTRTKQKSYPCSTAISRYAKDQFGSSFASGSWLAVSYVPPMVDGTLSRNPFTGLRLVWEVP